MITADSLRPTWHLLETQPPPTSELSVMEFKDIVLPAGYPCFALDNRLRRHVLLPVAKNMAVQTDTRSSGVQILAHRLYDRQSLRSFVDIICLKPHLHELFSVIICEMLNNLAPEEDHPDRICQQVLNRWRELLERAPSELPSIERLAGIFGELWHLRELTRRNPSALSCWGGPGGARHDFTSGSTALEVKTTLARHGRFFVIHGVEQLEPPAGGQLYLAGMKLEQTDASGALSLQSLIDDLVALGTNHHDLLALLMRADLAPAQLEQAGPISFRVVEDRIYHVTDTFPRIIARSFSGGTLPSGIIELTYRIDLSSEPPLPLDSNSVNMLYHQFQSGSAT